MIGVYKLNEKIGVPRIFTIGGVFAPPQSPYNITQELYSELIRGEVKDLDKFFLETATHWCEGDAEAAGLLAEALKLGDEAATNWPFLNWYHEGAGQTQGRWLTRPVVPDISILNQDERAAWECKLFTLPWDIGRPNIVFEGGIRLYKEEDFDRAVRGYDEKMFPVLQKALDVLDRGMKAASKAGAKRVIRDQRDRYQGFLLKSRTVRNLFESQAAINYYLLKKGDREAQRARLRHAVQAEIANTREWLALFQTSKTYFFRTAEKETPFLHKTPVEDMELKLRVMEVHIDDEPGPDLKELSLDYSEANLLYYE